MKTQHVNSKSKPADLLNLRERLARFYSESKFYTDVRIIQEKIRERKAGRAVQ